MPYIQNTIYEAWNLGNILLDEDEDLEWNSLSTNHTNDLLIISVNIGDSFRNKFDSILKLLNQTKADFLFMCEVHSFLEELNTYKSLLNRVGYNLFGNCENKPSNELFNFSKRISRNPKGGIVLLTKMNIQECY